MKTDIRSESSTLRPSTSAFVLSATVTVLFNSALACAKDAFPALNNFMKSVAGHHWTAHGLADLWLFLSLGFLFHFTKITERIPPHRLTLAFIVSVATSSIGLAFWYVFV